MELMNNLYISKPVVIIFNLNLLLAVICVKRINASSLQIAPTSITTKSTFCEYYNSSCINKGRLLPTLNTSECYGTQECDIGEGFFHGCQVTWRKANLTDSQRAENTDKMPRHSSGHDVIMMGCFPQAIGQLADNCLENETCIEDRSTYSAENFRAGVLFCCCRGSMCNKNFSWIPKAYKPKDPLIEEEHSSRAWFIIIPCTLLVVVLMGLFTIWYRNKKVQASNDLRNNLLNGRLIAPSLEEDCLLLGPLESIQLAEVIARGTFVVWKGVKTGDLDTEVAVKIFSMADQSSWVTEKEIYKLLRIEQENILKFLGVHIRPIHNMGKELWLITEYHEKGSLFEFLTNHLVSWKDLCSIAFGMTCGLNYLHEEQSVGIKPAIAHRDIKSKNVLIKSDLTPCLADFGLALVFEQGKPISDTYPQVGTRRYMAPEVLEGAIIFSRDQFFRIDMYAFALVLWELASRCATVWKIMNPSVTDETHNIDRYRNQDNSIGCTIEDYKLPFEIEAGVSNPSLEQMQDLVINQQIRPQFTEAWNKDAGMIKLIRTIHECWDQDAEARISASCVMERIQIIREDEKRAPNF